MNKILFFDVETAPTLGYVWGIYEQNVLATEKEWYMLSFAYKWEHQSRTYVKALPDYKTYKKDPTDDSELVKELWELFDEADIIVAHNGDRFDIRKTNARFISNGLNPPSTYQTIDTLKVARRYFAFNSNRLNDLGEHLGLGKKAETGGFKLWADCLKGVKSAWNTMKKYNKQDVVLLEKVYRALRPWQTNHPNRNVIDQTDSNCPTCGEDSLQKRGFSHTRVYTYQRMQCTSCGAWCRSRFSEKEITKPNVR